MSHPNYLVFDNLSDAKIMQRIFLALFELPKKGRHTGRGRHVPMPDIPPGTNIRNLPGWTTRYVDFIKHPSDNGQYAVQITPEFLTTFSDFPERLNSAQIMWLEEKLLEISSLTSDWMISDSEGNLYVLENEEITPGS
jgi:hypothetical protein